MCILKGKRPIILKDVASTLTPPPSLPHASSTLRHRRYILIKQTRSLEGRPPPKPPIPRRSQAILANVDARSSQAITFTAGLFLGWEWETQAVPINLYKRPKKTFPQHAITCFTCRQMIMQVDVSYDVNYKNISKVRTLYKTG